MSAGCQSWSSAAASSRLLHHSNCNLCLYAYWIESTYRCTPSRWENSSLSPSLSSLLWISQLRDREPWGQFLPSFRLSLRSGRCIRSGRLLAIHRSSCGPSGTRHRQCGICGSGVGSSVGFRWGTRVRCSVMSCFIGLSSRCWEMPYTNSSHSNTTPDPSYQTNSTATCQTAVCSHLRLEPNPCYFRARVKFSAYSTVQFSQTRAVFAANYFVIGFHLWSSSTLFSWGFGYFEFGSRLCRFTAAHPRSNACFDI